MYIITGCNGEQIGSGYASRDKANEVAASLNLTTGKDYVVKVKRSSSDRILLTLTKELSDYMSSIKDKNEYISQ